MYAGLVFFTDISCHKTYNLRTLPQPASLEIRDLECKVPAGASSRSEAFDWSNSCNGPGTMIWGHTVNNCVKTFFYRNSKRNGPLGCMPKCRWDSMPNTVDSGARMSTALLTYWSRVNVHLRLVCAQQCNLGLLADADCPSKRAWTKDWVC